MVTAGDLVKVRTNKAEEEGILMPSPDKDTILIKLENGYNIGFKKKNAKITLVKKASKKKETKSKLPSKKNLPTISILHTGGTIASKVDYRTGGVSAEFSPEELVKMFPELNRIANIKSELISQMWSDDLRFSHFKLIADKIQQHAKKSDGIIVGIGTDNLAVAAAALAFMIEESPVPIILVGSQRSSDRGSSDAAINLICAANFIINTKFGGVAICMHSSSEDEGCFILPAVKTYKLHSSRRDAFQAVNSSPLAFVDYKTGRVDVKVKLNPKSKELVIKPKMEEKVGLLKAHINMFPEQFSFYQGYKGLIIEGTGLGHIPGQVPNDQCKIHQKIYPAIKKLVDSGCVVVMTTQCLFGGVNLHVYDKGRDLLDLGVIPGKDMLANTALVKLSWLLGNYPVNKVKELVGKNLRGEINEQIPYEEDFVK